MKERSFPYGHIKVVFTSKQVCFLNQIKKKNSIDSIRDLDDSLLMDQSNREIE
jgi:hypothetical protein